MEYPQYNPSSDHRPLSDDELAALDELLAELPGDGVMTIEALDGYLAGLLLTPTPLEQRPGADWLPVIWGGDGDGTAPFASGKQKKRALMLVLRHVQSIALQWREQPDRWEPILSVAETEDGEEIADAEDWAAGFLCAVDLAAEAWDPLFNDPTLAALLEPIVLLGTDAAELDDAGRARLADPVERDALSRAVPESALALYGLRR
ncbi:MAG: UPF0149 family protein [Pelomonas sp.]|nr:UPF0149 family protein [Roseateles sp.]